MPAATPGDVDIDAGPGRRSRRLDRAVLVDRPWLLGLAVLVVGHIALIVARDYRTGGDWAFIELRTRDVFSAHSPLTGAWSRYGWNHPGPILYDLLAIPYRLTGSSWRGLWLGAMVLNGAAAVTAVRLLERRADIGSRPDGDTRVAAWAMAIAGLWTVAAGTPHLFTDPWNASVVVLPVLTMVAASAAVLLGDRRGVAVAAVVFVAVAQTHAAYGVLLLPLVAVALAVGVVRWRRTTVTWIGIASLLMVPTLVDMLVDWPGNFVRSIRFTLSSDEPAVGLTQAIRVVGRATSLTFFTEPRLPSFVATVRDPPWGVVPFAGLLAAVVALQLCRTRGWEVLRRLLEMTLLVWSVGALAMVSRTRGPLLIWLTTWMVAAAALTWCLVGAVALAWALDRRATRPADMVLRGCIPVSPTPGADVDHDLRADDIDSPVGPPGRHLLGVAAAVAAISVGLAVVNVAGSVGEGYPFQEYAPVVEQFADDIGALAATPIAIDLAGDEYVAGAVQSGLVVELEQRGFEPRGRPDQRLQMGEHRTDAPLVPPSLLVQVEPRSAAPVGATVVSVWDPLTDAERSEADALMDELGELLDGAGVGDRRSLLDNDLAPIAAFDAPPEVEAELASFERLGDLHARGQRIVLYLFDR